ncbi:hypothetical protein QC761_0103960 [Podospora bellae-mahoneyi]|uniref:Uncharacterized protein n=1 Tax=Podospora bellae-mahoneyi TaxID=2093777 RepID=A0ABR0F7P0_9PEZI|nr:hypothetical protein QC761_0103960 [Podospora bellae-mahoneyi]
MLRLCMAIVGASPAEPDSRISIASVLSTVAHHRRTRIPGSILPAARNDAGDMAAEDRAESWHHSPAAPSLVATSPAQKCRWESIIVPPDQAKVSTKLVLARLKIKTSKR